MISPIKKGISKTIDYTLYSLLTEEQKKTIANVLTDRQKNILRRLTGLGQQHTQKQTVKKLKDHLYSFGFTERALSELETLYLTTSDTLLKRLAAWELALWHANQYSAEGAKKALNYLPEAIRGERDKNQIRRAAIITAECLDLVYETKKGHHVIQKAIALQPHPDLYLAAANLETDIDQRLRWINKAMAAYKLRPITFDWKNQHAVYDDLKTAGSSKFIEHGPKVSVILPAYNAADGISTAIESILSQTWQNIELIIVDDCSSDHTKEVVRNYMKTDTRITLMSTKVNSGPYVARNIALQAAHGKYVTINDSDDWSHAEKIENQVKHLQRKRRMIANTSEHARLTEELKFYRRGTPGRYIFSNMSSLMFRRKPVMKNVGYWDSVRFAADGEYKRRLVRAFGKQRIADLKTGPLSLPRQSVSSLTGSSAFGYNGFFKGVRKEYVESLEYAHKQVKSFYYPFPQIKRPFPVPEPMWPYREVKRTGNRFFDVVIAADFRIVQFNDRTWHELHNQISADRTVGLLQMYQYDLENKDPVSTRIRDLIDGNQVQMVVYGEKIAADLLVITNLDVLKDRQQYIPKVTARDVQVFTNEPMDEALEKRCLYQLEDYFGKTGTWYIGNAEKQPAEQAAAKKAETGEKEADNVKS